GRFVGVYKLSHKGSEKMYIDYNGYFMKFFSNYIIWFTASNRNEQDIRVRYGLKIFRIAIENNNHVLEMNNPALRIDNRLLRKGTFLYYQ
ncbi:hypothetical protein L4D09_27875, partial [Photobacterium makurazakiensis]|uniref:hypothetical protein n=1 Tax=Photobacterium makurazakiensis TaxID=2910234 RepID=UPI003D0E3EF9